MADLGRSAKEIMRADICDPSEEKKVARFRAVLAELGAKKKKEGSGLGVDLRIVYIQKSEVRIFQDAWSLDIEGPEAIVSDIVERMKK